MRIFFILFYFLFFNNYLNAQWFEGYYITLTNDTVQSNIYIPVKKLTNELAISSIQKKIKVFVEGHEKTFKPTELNGFHILAYDGVTFKSIRINDKKTIFVQVITEGKIKLYKYDQVNLFRTLPGGGVGITSTGNPVPYIVKYGNKEYFFCKSLKKFLEYVNDDYFKERYETSYGNWGYLLENFAIDYNSLKKEED